MGLLQAISKILNCPISTFFSMTENKKVSILTNLFLEPWNDPWRNDLNSDGIFEDYFSFHMAEKGFGDITLSCRWNEKKRNELSKLFSKEIDDQYSNAYELILRRAFKNDKFVYTEDCWDEEIHPSPEDKIFYVLEFDFSPRPAIMIWFQNGPYKGARFENVAIYPEFQDSDILERLWNEFSEDNNFHWMDEESDGLSEVKIISFESSD